MNLRELLIPGVYDYDVEQLAAVQQRAIKISISGHDADVQAQSGTKKMKTVAIPRLQQLDVKVVDYQVLILTPTQKSVQEIQKIVLALGHYIDVTCYTFIDGTNTRNDMKHLEAGVQIVVGTPGYVYDMLKRSVSLSKNIKLLILNEADKVLSHGFKKQICNILKIIPQHIQVIHLSATMPSDVLEVTTKFTKNPIKILVKNKLTLEEIRQFYVFVEREERKVDMLCEFYKTFRIERAVIFCNTLRKVKWLTKEFFSRDFTVSAVHGNMNLMECHAVMRKFRTGYSPILNTADSPTPITEVPQISLIINYDLPSKPENYIHRTAIDVKDEEIPLTMANKHSTIDTPTALLNLLGELKSKLGITLTHRPRLSSVYFIYLCAVHLLTIYLLFIRHC
ncbi:unnamed protein product [Rotaria sp. Silwood1]|nr:unnamed protein product [Rotaria sp. Silwood1]